jgi:peptidyl-prolyl cis-trans isomerase SurA
MPLRGIFMGKRILRKIGLCAAILSAIVMDGGAAAAGAQGKNSRIVEEIIARVNNEIVTRSDLDKARAQVKDEAQHDCPTCTPTQIAEKVAPLEKDLLRDLIDNLLLVQRAKDLSINVDAEVIKRLDQIRQENNIASMEDLEKQMRAEGINPEDEKSDIRNQLYRDEVLRREVGSRSVPDKTEIQKYYDEHKQQFVRPESVYVREIFVSAENKTEEEKTALRAKADGLLARVKAGEDFGGLATHFSDAATAKKNGELGLFQRGMMPPALEDAVFKLNRNEFTDVIPIQTGFEILQVMEHYVAGQQPIEKVGNEITNVLYEEKMKSALREYLNMLRQDSYVDVASGYVDTAGVPSRPIEELPPTPEPASGGKKK